MVKVFYLLRHAQSWADRWGGKVFGKDKKGSRNGVDIVKKQYIAAPEAPALEHVYTQPPERRNFYETLNGEEPCYAYFDIDLHARGRDAEYYTFLAGVTTVEFSNKCADMWNAVQEGGFQRETQTYLRQFLAHFFKTALRQVSGKDITVHMLDASSPRKISLHVHSNLVLESNVIEGSCLAMTLNRLLLVEVWQRLRRMVENQDPDERAMHIMLLLPKSLPLSGKDASAKGFLDCAVYNRNQMFRMYGNTKMGSTRFLREVDVATGEVLPLPTTAAVLCAKAAGFLIQPSSGIPGTQSGPCFRVNPASCVYSSANAARAYTTRSQTKRSNEVSIGNKDSWRHTCQNASLDVLFVGDAPPLPRPASRDVRGAGSRHGGSVFQALHSDRELYREGETVEGVPAHALEKGQVVHCVECDLTADGRPDQNPSAAGIVTDDLDTGYYCFSCRKLYLVRHMVDYEGFKDNADATVNLGVEERYFDHRLVQNVFEGEQNKVIAVNARMGTGKTEAAKRMLRDVGKVLIVTYRQALATQLSYRFDANLYSTILGPLDADRYDRLVVCVDSLMRVQDTGYEHVLLDEAGFIRRHFMGRTMSGKNVVIYERLTKMLNYSKKVILLQDGLTNGDIEFYYAMLQGHDRIARIYVDKASHLRRARVSGSMSHTLSVLKATLQRGGKTFVPVSMKRCAVTLYDFVVSYCRPTQYQGDREKWRERVALVVGAESLCRGVKSAADFVSRYKDFDAVVATSVLETGVSLDGHFTDVIAFFTRIPLLHRSQVQLINRVRSPQSVTLFAEEGLGKRYRGDKKLLARLYGTEVAVRPEFLSTFVDIQSECADVLNNNLSLWPETWNSRRVTAPPPPGELYKKFLQLQQQHQQGVKRSLLQTEVTGDSLTSDFRAALITEDALLCKETLERMLIDPALMTARFFADSQQENLPPHFKCELRALKTLYWRTVMYFLLENHNRATADAQGDSEWSEILASSAKAGLAAPFHTASLVHVGQKLMILMYGSTTPPGGTTFLVSDDTYRPLYSGLKALQKWIGTRHYTHHVGKFGVPLRKISALHEKGKSINKVLIGLLRKTTPFHFKCARRVSAVLNGMTQRVTPITVQWPLPQVGVLLGGARSPRAWGESMLAARDAMVMDHMEGFITALKDWAGEYTTSARSTF